MVRKNGFRFPKPMRASTHNLGQALLSKADSPVRAITVGPFTLMWNGRKSDIRPVVPTSDIFRNSR